MHLHPRSVTVINLSYLSELVLCTAYFSLSFLATDFQIFVQVASNLNNV